LQVGAGGYLQGGKGVAESVDGCVFESGVRQEFFVPFCDGLVMDGGAIPLGIKAICVLPEVADSGFFCVLPVSVFF